MNLIVIIIIEGHKWPETANNMSLSITMHISSCDSLRQISTVKYKAYYNYANYNISVNDYMST